MPTLEDAPNGTEPILIDQAGFDVLLGQAKGDAAATGDAANQFSQSVQRVPVTGIVSIRITGSTSTETGPEYTVTRLVDGGAISHSGLVLCPDITYRARNVADDLEPATEPLPNGTVILEAKPSMRDGKQILLFDVSRAVLPIPQYQYMVMQAVSQNQLGADWTRAHDLI